ncbi:PREDICTED: cytochrome P450 4C1-like [Wasmannia auropunctata]|uniref:cytochrome P450 4C1-like n=1 Tax=Wasmannia auropunctata TaxID=64793 RepID=UPI0005EECCE7|nr:PREDICTED: cytochrome P450 4C1-like [Wasmannia auropunctata]
MGTSLENHGELQEQYRKAVIRMGEIYSYKLTWQWLYPTNWIFSLTSTGKEEAKVLKILHGFTKKIIAERKLYHERTNGQYLKNLDESAKADDAEATGST